MISTKDKALLTITLVALFGAGVGTGLLLARKDRPATQAATSPPNIQPAAVAAAPGDWWQNSLDRLVTDLKLTAEQRSTVEPLLKRSADQIFLNRDRALFQMHLELLAFHENLGRRPHLLDAAQRQGISRMDQALRRQIQAQFPQFLKENPLPQTAQVSP